jgi:Uma2 family endonuclease
MTATLDATLDTVPPRLLDPEDLLSMPNGDLYELIDGIPVEKPMGAQASGVNVNLMVMLANFVKQHRLGHVFDSDGGYACFPGRPKLFRKPDSSFVARGRFPDDKPPVGTITIAPDLLVEVVSPWNSYEEIAEKVRMFLDAGTRLIWVVVPKIRSATVHRLDGTTTTITSDGILSGEDVVPGFTCRIAELFDE